MAALQAKGAADKSPKLQNFKVLKSLGEGSYGKVYKVQRNTDEQCYALKETELAQMKQNERQDAVNEIRLLVSINHPNVIRYHEAFLNGSKLCVIMEYAPFGDLRYYITKAGRLHAPFPEEAIWRIFLQLCRGLAELHSSHIIHRDIKPANIFLCANDLLKIGDLGISKALTHLQFTRTSIGTPIYMAPEVWAERPYSYSSDMWSVGCVLYEMMTFAAPFNGRSMQDLGMRVRSGRYNPIKPGSYSPELIAFAHSMLVLDPKKRPTAQEIISHAASAKWMRILPSPPCVRRHSENGGPARGLGPMHRPSQNGGPGLLDTIMVPRDLRQLPRVLPPACYDSDDAPSPPDQQPARAMTPAPAVKPLPAPPAVVQQPRQRSVSPAPPPIALPAPRFEQRRPAPLSNGQPPRAPSPASALASPASSPAAARMPSNGVLSAFGGGSPLLNNRPPLPRMSEPGCGLPPVAAHQRPRSAVYDVRPAAGLPALPPVRASADGPLLPGNRGMLVPSVVPPPRRVSYS